MSLVLLGMSHRTAPLALRERYAVDDPRPLLSKLKAFPEVEEAVMISTCNRVEILALTREPDAARARLRSFLETEMGGPDAAPPEVLDEVLYEHAGREAVLHVFRVASSVDSMVVGEPQILGQVKEAYRAAQEVGACGPILGRLYERAFATAKRVRNETRIAERPISVARVGVDLAKQIFESLADKSALLVGAGKMIELALDALRSEGLAAVRVLNRTRARAEALAERFAATAHALPDLPDVLARSDVVLTSIAGDEPVLTVDVVRQALATRRQRPIFVIDLGVPRNVDPAVNEIDNVYVYDMDDLAGVAAANASERKRETELAEWIVREEEQRFDGWRATLDAVPTIRALREHVDVIRARELARFAARTGLPPEQREAVAALTRGLVNKILHAPIARLRRESTREDQLRAIEAARELFALDEAGRETPSDADDSDAPEPSDPS